ncbi:HD-GYP domain-containing protein [Clostridium sp. 19966]|uniref:HD-GYP domain-containing protein n=1 Tax=Clostridium sp. 19966 TaxID=2768166 RepID=UPI0028E257F3|nr:HD-GYP domain-containing protein [Clostridium sp. 19966]
MKLQREFNYFSWRIFGENTKIFRGITFFIFILAVVLSKYVYYDRPNPIFTVVMVAAGISLFSVFQQLAISVISSMTLIYFSPSELTHGNNYEPLSFLHFMSFFYITCFSHFIICFLISYLIKTHSKQQKDTVQFIMTLARTIESRDNYTAFHSKNVAEYARIIANKLKYSKAECEIIFTGALLYDIGKIGISDNILNKPARLTKEEYNIIKQHPSMGFDMVKPIENFKENKILDMILYHNERYDGKGYPSGLRGKEIPECAAIIAVADAFDAMTSSRVYRERQNFSFAINELRKYSGTQFYI